MTMPRPLLPLCLLLPGALLARTPATSARTAAFSKPSAAATCTSSHPGAAPVKAESNKLTFRNAGHSFTLVSGKGVSYQQNGVRAPAQLQVAAFHDGSGSTVNGVPIGVSLVGGQDRVRDLSINCFNVSISPDCAWLEGANSQAQSRFEETARRIGNPS